MGAQGFRNMPSTEDSVLILQSISCKSCRGRHRIAESAVEISEDSPSRFPESTPLLELEDDQIRMHQGALEPLSPQHESYPNPTVQPIAGTVVLKTTPVHEVPNGLTLTEASLSSNEPTISLL
eukprot:TRINITY_DN13127_c0_g2_i1.p1 TRINITY_DN13127_c0_g2~~TRINITY_DN13127_c0_g2_i1.p1  ORF type:complete len:123 (+),score=7.00 TRINITY_DN13127_c0_g2_i1:217-585(+)